VAQYLKPVIYDECMCKGSIPRRWGNISSQELVRRFWLSTVSGVYVGRGETYLDANNILWWSKGSLLHGDSPARIGFLRKLFGTAPAEDLRNVLTYRPAEYEFDLAKDATYSADITDPWAMTIAPVESAFSGKFTMKLPGKPFLAVRFVREDR
jgi:hypothetical protein